MNMLSIYEYACELKIWATVGTSLVVRIRGIQTWRLDPKGCCLRWAYNHALLIRSTSELYYNINIKKYNDTSGCEK